MGKCVSYEEIIKISRDLKNQGKKIAFTNGCYDLFHYGHLMTFQEAKRVSDIVIVGVNSDESIKRIKGDKRPIINEIYRASLIAALECVDYVVIFGENSPSKLIEEIKPSVYLKGSDWKGKKLPEEEIIRNVGGEINYVELVTGLSSTTIIERIMEVYGN